MVMKMKKNWKRMTSLALLLLSLVAWNLSECCLAENNGNLLYKTPLSPLTFDNAVYGGTLRVGTRFSGVNNIGYPFIMATNSCWEQIAACPAIEPLVHYDESGKIEP
jgi:hypothetical protein